MKLTYLLRAADLRTAPVRSLLDQAALLAHLGHSVTVLSVFRPESTPPHARNLHIEHVLDQPRPGLQEPAPARRSVLIPPDWEPGYPLETDNALRRRLFESREDAIVTNGPGLAAAAARLLPESTALVYQEHRPAGSLAAPSGLMPLTTSAARLDLVTSPVEVTGRVLAESLPGVVNAVLPHAVTEASPSIYRPQSALDSPLIVGAAGAAWGEPFRRLVIAFGQVADQLPGWRLRLVGAAKGRDELARPIRKFGLYDRVELPGAVSDMPSEWARGAFSVHVSRGPDLPGAVLQSLGAGVPAIAYDYPTGARDLIDHERNGLLVPAHSVPGMAGAILRLASDIDLRAQLGQQAVQSFQTYARQADAARWESLLIQAVAHRRRSRSIAATAVIDDGAPMASIVADCASQARNLTPREAITTTLLWATRAASRASDDWFAMPASGHLPPTLVVPMDARTQFLDALGEEGAPTEISLLDVGDHGWPERRGPLRELASELRRGRTARMRLGPWPGPPDRPSILAHGCEVSIEFWERSPKGELIAGRGNHYVASVSPHEPRVPTVLESVEVQTLPLITRPTVRETRFPIDVVYTWVNGEDPVWNDARLRRLATVMGTGGTRESSGQARFMSRDELRYSLRSVHLFAPWVRKIHIVTAGQVPPWLTPHPKVQLVDHKEILPSEALPTFNSHAIETALHRIPGLAEHWIYFNDDMFLGHLVRPDIFFTPTGQPAVFPEDVGLGDERSEGAELARPWIKAAWNNRRLLETTFDAINTTPMRHTPYAHRTSTIAEIEARFPHEIEQTRLAPFRSDTDVSMLSSLAQYYGLATGTAILGIADDAFVDISSVGALERLDQLRRRTNDFFCLGDHHDHALSPARLRDALTAFFKEYFPMPAPWEQD